MTIAWSKRPTYEEVLETLDTDYKVKLPDRSAVSFYDSFAMGQFREMQQQITFEDKDGVTQTLQRHTASTATETLGVFLAPDGNSKVQRKKMEYVCEEISTPLAQQLEVRAKSGEVMTMEIINKPVAFSKFEYEPVICQRQI